MPFLSQSKTALHYIVQTIFHTTLYTQSSTRWTFLSSAPSTSVVLSIQAMRTKRGRSRRSRRRFGESRRSGKSGKSRTSKRNRRRGWLGRRSRIVIDLNKN